MRLCRKLRRSLFGSQVYNSPINLIIIVGNDNRGRDYAPYHRDCMNNKNINDRDKRNAYQREYRHTHKEKINGYQQKYRSKKAANK